MKLTDYLKQIDRAARDAFAVSCKTSLGHLRNVAYGCRRCGPELAALVELHSQGQVTRRELCPDNWRLVWPELAKIDAALRHPAPPASDNHAAAAGQGA